MYRNHPRHRSQGPRHSFARHSRAHGRGGPRARRGDIRAAVLALLAEKPAHGYEMIKQIEERTGGAWKPSAGSIYPTLQLLEDEGLIEGQEDAGKRRFSLTDEGREANDSHEGDAPWDQVTAGAPQEGLKLAHSAAQLRPALGQVLHHGNEEQRKRVRELLDETRRQIYSILSEDA